MDTRCFCCSFQYFFMLASHCAHWIWQQRLRETNIQTVEMWLLLILIRISYNKFVTNEEVKAQIINFIGPNEEILIPTKNEIEQI